MRNVALVPIVEGHGEVKALPVLLHRIRNSIAEEVVLRVNDPIRVKAGQFLNSEEHFDRYVVLAAERAATLNGHVIILLDSEDFAPCVLGPDLLTRARAVRNDVNFIVALAYREFETWFIAAAVSLRGVSGLPNDLLPAPNPQGIRGAKEWLSQRLPNGYDEIIHQVEFARAFDFDAARSIHSFARLFKKLEKILKTNSPH
jgi:hypothetical protein